MSALWLEREPLLLASGSATRAALLRAAALPFEARRADVDERALESRLVEEGADGVAVALALAREKALAVSRLAPGRLTLGADQTLTCGARRFAKPGSRAGAAATLEALSGRVHELHSALALARGGIILFDVVKTARLTMRALSPGFVEAYLDAVGEAAHASVGAYQAEGPGVHLFEEIEGDHSTILGLPLLPLLAFLRAQGFVAS
ncbi:Maf family protein [Methylocella sp.]|uniref:Maf family protein n=1 Tax=Methylocella sp. TaxID=1978226 RepID=UPI003784D484